MTVSQPSKLVYIIDIPRVKNLTANFVYNFFTPDECTNDTGGIPTEALMRPASTIDASFIQWSLTRVPREIDFSFSLPKLADIGRTVSAQSQRDNTNKGSGAQYGSLIKDNIKKVVDEDYFSADGFIAVNFHDSEIDSKIQTLVSSSIETQALESETPTNTSPFRSSMAFTAVLPSHISPHFIFRAMSLHNAYGAQFFNSKSAVHGRVPAPTQHPKKSQIAVISNYFERLKKVSTNTQVNAKLLQDMIGATVKDPTSTFSADIANMHNYAKQAKQATNKRFSTAVSADDYKTFVPFISVRKQHAGVHHSKYTAEIVGFIIDKLEVFSDGTTKKHNPIVIESPHISSTADFRVKFHADYCYTIRTIAMMTLPAIDDNNGDVATARLLISSKPSHKVYVKTTKLVPPPPPGDVSFVWHYGRNKLMVTWAFPVWSQRDVKQFQVFRRQNIKQPFQLQKVYNFDDSAVKFPSNEQPDPSLVEFISSPCQYYHDEDFDWLTQTSEDRGFIYSIACIDAHGLTSCLSAQFLVWFDRFKNALQVKHISHVGAPKPYPNMYLDGDVFSNTIKVSGGSSRQFKLYFNPEFYYVYDDQNRMEQIVATKQNGAKYKLQFINMDNGKAADVDIVIDDKLLASSHTLSKPQVALGPKRNNVGIDRS